MRRLFQGLLACIAICIALPGWAQGVREYRIEIDRLPLSSALRQFSLQTGLQVGRLPDVRASDKTFVGPLRGRYTAEAALTQLLARSGYSFKQVNERTIAIVAATSTPPRTASARQRRARIESRRAVRTWWPQRRRRRGGPAHPDKMKK